MTTAAALQIAPGVTLPVDLVTESNAILGKKGSGKTSAGVVLYEEMYEAGVPVVAVDPKGDWYGIRSSASGKSKGIPVPVFGGLHGDIPLEATGGKALAVLIREQHMSCILDVSEFSASERRKFLTPFADHLYRADDRTPMHLVLEEAHEYIPQRVDAGDAPMVGVFERLVKNGRYKGIGVTMMSQRSASLNKNVLTQVDNLFVMRTTSPQDRAAVSDWIKFEDGSAEILASMSSLQSGECWLYQPNRGEPVRFRFRMRNTFDAGATPKVGEVRTQPTNLADVDLTSIAAAMAETIEKAKADDPKELRRELAGLRRQLAEKPPMAQPQPSVMTVEVPIVADDTIALIQEQIAAGQAMLAQMGEVSASLSDAIAALREVLAPARPTAALKPPQVARAVRQEGFARPPADVVPAPREGTIALRSGARRMVEALGRMAPLRLTKSQWGTVAKLKTTGGTWSTYFSDIRRAGLIDEGAAGYTLSEAGFDYLGGRPEPMTPEELQEHYRSILRSGAVKMLDAIIEAYPEGLGKAEIGEAAGIAITGGTFSTYLSDLIRNGLAERRGECIVATEILIHGAYA